MSGSQRELSTPFLRIRCLYIAKPTSLSPVRSSLPGTMATSPITPFDLLALASKPPNDPVALKALHDAARSLVFATESPSDTESRIQNSFTVLPLVKIATDLDLFNILASQEQPWHVDALAKKTGAEANLLHRLLHFLTTQALITEVDIGTYIASHLTPHVQPSGFKAGVKHNTAWTLPTLAAFPEWLRKNDYRTPSGSKDCAFQDGVNTELDCFEYLGAYPEQAAATFEYMAWQKIRNKSWMDGSAQITEEFQLSEREVKDGRALLVDVGGGGGHQCFDFRAAFPERKGRLVVQDTEVMVGMFDKQAAEGIGLEPMAYDFFTPQSMKGGKVYYLRTVLHDWNDENAIKILKRLAEAVAEDSVVVLDEIVVPPKGASEKQVLYDVVMMATVGSGERSEEQWRSLLEAAGLRLREVAIYDDEMNTGLVVAVKA